MGGWLHRGTALCTFSSYVWFRSAIFFNPSTPWFPSKDLIISGGTGFLIKSTKWHTFLKSCCLAQKKYNLLFVQSTEKVHKMTDSPKQSIILPSPEMNVRLMESSVLISWLKSAPSHFPSHPSRMVLWFPSSSMSVMSYWAHLFIKITAKIQNTFEENLNLFLIVVLRCAALKPSYIFQTSFESIQVR